MTARLGTVTESLRSALASIWAHRLRSFLTALGIIIGVASVVAVVSIVQGLSRSISDQFQGLGTNTLTVRSSTPFRERLTGDYAKLTPGDMQAIEHDVAGIQHVTPTVSVLGVLGGSIQYRGHSASTQVFGTTARYQDLYSVYPAQGRFLTPSDDKTRRRVCVIGPAIIDSLDLPQNPIGQFLQIGGEWFKIVGLMQKRGEMLGFNQDDYVMIPYGSARSLMGISKEPDITVNLTVKNLDDMDTVKARISQVLRQRHGLKGKQEDDFQLRTSAQLMDSIKNVTGTVTMVVGGIVGISLIVGGVGIMNIMLVSVTERTREIGILKALGAQRSDILLQFLIEALTLCLLGGIIGLAIGFGLGALVSAMIPTLPPAFVPWWAVALSFGFSAGVGLIFGILPAAKAANLDPIDALRYE